MRSRIAGSVVLVALAAGLTGCGYDINDVSYDNIVKNITPELAGSFQRQWDEDFNVALNNSHDLRLMSDEITRMWYLDHPSRLSPLPVMYTSGMPR